MRHTPGPWEACNGSSVSTDEETIIVPDHVRRVSVDSRGRRVTQFVADCNVMLPEVAANARLIAAAPELLDIAKSVVSFLRCVEWDKTTDANESAALETALDIAIAKAEGKEP